jgi:alpha/beta superfamily hydrolase
VTEARLRIASGGHALDARLSRPAGAARGSVVVAHPHPAHGGHMDQSVVRAVADAATHAGLCALRFDFRGVRASEGDVSDLAGHVEDVGRAAARAREECPGGLALGAGYSYGARRWVDAMTGDDPPAVSGLLLLAPPTRIPRSPRDFGHLLLGRPLRETTTDLSVVHGIARLSVPIHVVVGSDDVVAPPSEYDRLRPPHRVTVLPGLNHFFARGPGAGPSEAAALPAALEAAFADLLSGS